jgi:hypothetical protein
MPFLFFGPAFLRSEDSEKRKDRHIGMRPPGIVANMTVFGAFVDSGMYKDIFTKE